MSGDPLDRFVEAQNPVYARVLTELRGGHKESHWMWFIFPQIAGLGFSAMAQRYAIGSLAEAEAYLSHPLLGPRLRECTQWVLDVKAPSAETIFGAIDAMKFRSSMTLFSRAAPDERIFRAALDMYFGGVEDEATLERL